jgi:hypothetical protein
MSVFGGGCLNVRVGVREFATSRLTEVTIATVPAGTAPALRKLARWISIVWFKRLVPFPIRSWCRQSRYSEG